MNEHNGKIPRDDWLEEWEKEAIVSYYQEHREEGYRRITYMMMDREIVAVSPSTTYRVLKRAGCMNRWKGKASKKGRGFVQPVRAHEHWHVDISSLPVVPKTGLTATGPKKHNCLGVRL